MVTRLTVSRTTTPLVKSWATMSRTHPSLTAASSTKWKSLFSARGEPTARKCSIPTWLMRPGKLYFTTEPPGGFT